MRYTPLSKDTYINHRKNFASKLPEGAMAIFNSNDVMPTNADGNMNFRQNNDLLYLSGVDQEESILVIFPESFSTAHREILFLKETSPSIAIWEGDKLDKKQATELSGIKNIFWLDQFEAVLKGLMSEAKTVFLNSNEHTRRSNEVETRDMRFNKQIKENYLLHKYDRVAPIMHRLRSIKSTEEIEQMQRACNITEAGLRRVLKFVKPGVKEFEIEAEFMHEFLRRGSRGFAYTPIIASGFNACVLHYIENNEACKDGDLILMDVGCEYGNYASDMTRTIPVNGKFTERQKAVYNSVLHVMKECKKMLRPGVFLNEYHKKVGDLMEVELIKLGLLTQDDIDNQDPATPAYKEYFMHGTSHFIGLDVHDVGLWSEPIEAGMVFTVEPGIYIRDERIGIRLENDIVITEKGFDDLMGNIPLEVEEIEALMAENA
ncbi:M24 family metallopeptidase [Cryomorpha ignava]|uniref:Xaa-Pro aminopeptidase n=1 Tax=Cryomorpha ignava TaxID=101383 RepID=A0A7K3WSZ3_9FLAO|nr:aminopeptidase P N-terminal domain-containing protein [Cryomorpha ignava]NEN24813.1 M24 family metallopeptidase [Cryomorpha ignava]